MFKTLLVFAALIAVAYCQQNYVHSIVYAGQGCAEADVVSVASTPIDGACADYKGTLDVNCTGASFFGVGFYAKTRCGDMASVNTYGFGTVEEKYEGTTCTGNLTKRTFYGQNKCISIGFAGGRYSCSGDDKSGRISVTGCLGNGCDGICNTVSADFKGCQIEGTSSSKQFCGYSAAPATAIFSVAALVFAVAALLF